MALTSLARRMNEAKLEGVSVMDVAEKQIRSLKGLER